MIGAVIVRTITNYAGNPYVYDEMHAPGWRLKLYSHCKDCGGHMGWFRKTVANGREPKTSAVEMW